MPPARGAQVQLSNCAYTKSGNDVEAPQKWLLAKWTEPLPKKVQPPLLNSLWTNYDRGYRKAAARIDNGMVTIDGMIKIRAADQNSRTLDFNEPIDVLPPAMRPDKRLVFNANSHGTLARVDILPNGRVRLEGRTKKTCVDLARQYFLPGQRRERPQTEFGMQTVPLFRIPGTFIPKVRKHGDVKRPDHLHLQREATYRNTS